MKQNFDYVSVCFLIPKVYLKEKDHLRHMTSLHITLLHYTQTENQSVTT